MVSSITSLGRSGLSDWLIQRVTAVIMLAYFIFLMVVLLCESHAGYEAWSELFSCVSVRIFSTVTLLSVVAHSWIGGWGVLTDYVTERFFKLELGMNIGSRASILRLLMVMAMILLMIIYTLWGLDIIWGFSLEGRL